MQIKKTGGRIFGALLTAAEKKAMDIEIQKELKEYYEHHWNEMDAVILWNLHTQFGFGKKRLKRFYTSFVPLVKDLVKRYELEDKDQIWMCEKQLKEYGVDLKKWINNEE